MALTCLLNRNISLVQPSDSGGTDSCKSQDITMGVGGISSPVLVYNISDVPSLTFEGDNRSDYSLFVETINSTGQFYKVDHTDAAYNEEYDTSTHKWTHSLTLSVANIQPLFEDILADGVNGKYLVCFRPNGAEDYRMFGWRGGAALDYSLNIQSDSHGYSITFDDVSEYPLLTVDKDNFGSKTKVYTPIFKPLYDVAFCEQDGGRHTGYLIAMYVVKTNAAGQPLDRNNQLCQWSNLKQDAYKIQGIASDGGYNIIGTYAKDATFDGKPVKVYDLKKCPANVTNSIYINSKKAETINLNSTISGRTFNITSSDEWSMVSDPQFVTISPVEGENGQTQCHVYHNGVGGIDHIQFMNSVTKEIVTLDVIVNLISAVSTNYTMSCLRGEYVITPSVEGCSSAYTYTVAPNISNTKDENGYIHIYPSPNVSGTYTLTLMHECDPNEKKVITINVVCESTDPIYETVREYCETKAIDSGKIIYTGYRITIQQDVNPNSPTFMSTNSGKTADSSCGFESPTWQAIDNYCELADGVNTGYYITTYVDINQYSETYGKTKEEKTLDQSKCPKPNSDSIWLLDPKFEPYCEQKVYEPSMLEANSGRLIARLVDDNKYSSSYGQTVDSALTESDWDSTLQSLYGDFPCEAPDTNPKVEAISEACQLVIQPDGTVKTNGYKNIVGLDKNPYSSTYLSSITQTVQDLVKCPSGQTTDTYVFELDDWGTSREETVESDTRQIIYDLTTTKNGEYIGYTVSENCSWLSTDKGMDYITLFFENNTSSSDRECEVTLTQNESENEITINVTQKKKAEVYTPYTLSDRYLIDGSLPSEEFYIYYFATDSNWSTIITDGVTLEIVESGFTFTEIDSGIDSNGRKYKKYRASENTTNIDKIARFKAVYNGVDSNITRIKQSGKDQTILPDFDYLTFIFNWDAENGRDFDTATYVSGTPYTISGKTLYELPVGYNCDGSKEQYSAATSVYLQHGGDNTQSGDECALINWKTICNYDYISAGITTLYCDLYGNWYREFGDGNCRVTYKTYKGDGMKHGTEENKYIFVPSGNTELVTEKTISGNVRAFSSTNASSEKKENYSKIARFEYDIATKSALLTNLMVTPSGRNLRGYATIGGEVIKGLNDANVGSLKYNYNSSAQSGSISIGSFYNIINGTRYDAESISLEIKYYKKGGDVLQEGYATATLENGILSWTIEANTSGYDREVDFYITGTESHRNIIYRIDCVQSA